MPCAKVKLVALDAATVDALEELITAWVLATVEVVAVVVVVVVVVAAAPPPPRSQRSTVDF